MLQFEINTSNSFLKNDMIVACTLHCNNLSVLLSVAYILFKNIPTSQQRIVLSENIYFIIVLLTPLGNIMQVYILSKCPSYE